MKPGWLWRIAVGITPESEEAVTELLSRLFGQPASVCSEVETGTLRAMIFLARRSAWSPRHRAALRAGLQHIRTCGLDLGAGRISAVPIPREDWAESWKRHFKPIEVGLRLLIKPSWSRRQPKLGQKVMVLNPGLSFGTGQHPTTGFCLQQLVAARKQDAGQSLLDMGTGSGILAIAGFKLGYRPVVAFDCDPAAVRIARANARRNRAKVRFSRQDLARWASHEPPLQAGRDAFHCVPDLSGRDGDAVERVPTGFMAGEQVRMEQGASHEPARGRSPAAAPQEVAATGDRSWADSSRFMAGEPAPGSHLRGALAGSAGTPRPTGFMADRQGREDAGTSFQTGPFDVVCANLTADLLLAHQRRIIQSVKRFGLIVLSGILGSQFAEVRRAYERAGLRLVARQREREWESAAFACD